MQTRAPLLTLAQGKSVHHHPVPQTMSDHVPQARLECFLLSFLSGKVFGESSMLIFRALYNYLRRPT